MLIFDYLSLSKDYLLTLIKISKYFILFYYYHICLPQLIWNSSACHKHAPGRRGIVYAQAGPNWVAVGPVSTPLLRIFGSNTTGGNLACFNQKRPTTKSKPTCESYASDSQLLVPQVWNNFSNLLQNPRNPSHCFPY